MLQRQPRPDIEEATVEEWFALMQETWRQGEHVVIIGPTGSGKTRIAQRLLEIRGYVVVLAVKKNDETLERFMEGAKYGFSKYKVISDWPPPYPYVRVILWAKPKELEISLEQKQKIAKALNAAYLAGGWTVFFDDAGYITGFLGQAMKLGILLNQGRSDHLTTVSAITQPKSVVARVPSETFKQVRHKLAFYSEYEDEVKATANIFGMNWRTLQGQMEQLGEYDFLYRGKRRLLLVRNHL